LTDYLSTEGLVNQLTVGGKATRC